MPYYFIHRIVGFMPSRRVLALYEMKTASSMNWLRIAVSISNDDTLKMPPLKVWSIWSIVCKISDQNEGKKYRMEGMEEIKRSVASKTGKKEQRMKERREYERKKKKKKRKKGKKISKEERKKLLFSDLKNVTTGYYCGRWERNSRCKGFYNIYTCYDIRNSTITTHTAALEICQ